MEWGASLRLRRGRHVDRHVDCWGRPLEHDGAGRLWLDLGLPLVGLRLLLGLLLVGLELGLLLVGLGLLLGLWLGLKQPL